jgi:hypothetical protein
MHRPNSRCSILVKSIIKQQIKLKKMKKLDPKELRNILGGYDNELCRQVQSEAQDIDTMSEEALDRWVERYNLYCV